jgi:hypothetical protein
MNFKQNHLIELWMIVLKLILAIGCSVNRKNKKRDKSKKEDLSRCVPWVGIEPTLCCQNWILNPARLPVPPPRHYFKLSRSLRSFSLPIPDFQYFSLFLAFALSEHISVYKSTKGA